MDITEIRAWIIKKRELLIIVSAAVIFILCLVIGVSLRSAPEKTKEKDNVVYLKKPPIKEHKGGGASASENNQASSQQQGGSLKAYFTEISPEDILQKIEEYRELEAVPADYKINHLPVGWRLYFFSRKERKDQPLQVILDTQETGFGATVVLEVDVSHYPQFLDMQEGQKIWVAGSIEGVNPDGTGTFFIKPEHFGFDGDPPESDIGVEADE